jgi:hypothetical protein
MHPVGRMTITDKADFKAKVRASMRQLQNDPDRANLRVETLISIRCYRWVPTAILSSRIIRASERWRSIKVTEFERRQLAAVRKELDQEYEAHVGLKTQLSKDATPLKISSNPRT